ncbi:hypothetical protein MGG_08820 [Pyricularia oryzae 70-15]|uniref:Filamentation protein n=3 Tax=Pyricularia oryzae TaxID=318829 RepID=G4MUQ6_PYRO7|nr:uncharacterized protein MGG_08820 [Pyricularia oryzae 70-15]EHA54029.1 hypothetical protein MGG_08820 [Pyricularia oryzae 70-15]ELQ42176.1 hypothetical protein OOU_Y34scaffold00228g67 [Pyricularia oryzae Y34]KAI7922656.1 hypothetical protein M9X92_004769 [Pyricularia oryzae]KAI7932330.1 hypothetical protein M0657_000460 [Pyricularia oryzae]
MSKAAHYIQALDDARCDGDWEAVPELVRKVRKHAPDRKCLTLTAEIECAIEKNAQKLSPGAERPATKDGNAPTEGKELEVSSELPRLLSAIDAETSFPEDKYQANVCVGWLHWVVGEYHLAAVRLPRAFESEQISESQASEWTRVCALKSAYLRANVLARAGNRLEALLVFRDGLPSISTEWTNQKSRKQLRYWSELFLTEYCMMFSSSLEKGETTLDDPNSLACYRSWARYWESAKGVPVGGGYGFRGSIPRRVIWGQYHSALSAIVEEDLSFPTGFVVAPSSNDSSARSQLRAELKNVEKIHETLLLNETEFPNAEEEREEIEEFVHLACQNWRVLCGRGWRDQDLGPGGREGLSRGVLDILYRASMKTYHSTSILRHLFTIHVAVAEFDLAFKAFDSYLELVKKGKARVQKSGQPEPSLDDEATVLETVSAAIAILCRYGHRQASEKAVGLAAELEEILNKLPAQPQVESGNTLREDESAFSAAGETVPPRIIALAWQAIGLANAQWARMTFDSKNRGDIHAKAIRSLKKSLSGDLKRTGDVRGIFALGVLLAEQRDLTPAIELTKQALLLGKTSPGTQNDLHNGSHWRERSLIPVWHLLSLLLSARQDFVMAARACEGAFEQFKDPSVLFGSEQVFRSDHLNEAEQGAGLVDVMDDFEKESILEVKMTQLALVELLEGPKIAVNASLELLSLFNRLFGTVEEKKASPPKTEQVPKSSAGTMRSIRGSIFGRSDKERTGRPSTRQPSTLEPISSRPTTTHSMAPTIQVTQEDGEVGDTNYAKKAATISGRSQSHRRQSLRKRDSTRGRSASVGPAPQHPTVVDGESYFTPVSEMGPSAEFFASAPKRPSSSAGAPVALTRTFSQAESFASSSRGRTSAADFSEVSRGSIEFSPLLLPLIQFPKSNEQRRRSTILIKVWLMIAGFYRRAGLYDDGKAAIAEAQRLLQALEAVVAQEETVAFGDSGWANSKSIDELWGDVWAEMGNLSLAKEVPYSARSEFESALTHCPAHPAATIGLSNILLDLYSEKLPPPPTIPGLQFNDHNLILGTKSAQDLPIFGSEQKPKPQEQPSLPKEPLGLRTTVTPTKSQPRQQKAGNKIAGAAESDSAGGKDSESELQAPYKALSLPIVDRLAARDRAHGLLTGLTKLGSAWNMSEAWFALARAHEESGQIEKAREVLWWCVELEESVGVREWRCLGNGGYIL